MLLHMVWQMGQVREHVSPLWQKCFLLKALLLYGYSCASHSSHLLPPLLQRKSVPGIRLRGIWGAWPAYNYPENHKTLSTLISLYKFLIKVCECSNHESIHHGDNTERLCAIPVRKVLTWFLTVKAGFSCFVYYKWNHALCILLHLSSSVQHHVYEVYIYTVTSTQAHSSSLLYNTSL